MGLNKIIFVLLVLTAVVCISFAEIRVKRGGGGGGGYGHGPGAGGGARGPVYFCGYVGGKEGSGDVVFEPSVSSKVPQGTQKGGVETPKVISHPLAHSPPSSLPKAVKVKAVGVAAAAEQTPELVANPPVKEKLLKTEKVEPRGSGGAGKVVQAVPQKSESKSPPQGGQGVKDKVVERAPPQKISSDGGMWKIYDDYSDGHPLLALL